MNTLTIFASFSGLKVNTEKTKLNWIRSKKRTRYKLCKEWNMDWSQTQFKLFGIEFDVDLDKMIGKKYNKKFHNIEKKKEFMDKNNSNTLR